MKIIFESVGNPITLFWLKRNFIDSPPGPPRPPGSTIIVGFEQAIEVLALLNQYLNVIGISYDVCE